VRFVIGMRANCAGASGVVSLTRSRNVLLGRRSFTTTASKTKSVTVRKK
jgi:hypothetical protein